MIHQRKSISGFLIICFLIGFAIVCILPFYYVITVSFSEPYLVREGSLILYPKGFSLKSYNVVLRDNRFFQSFKISVLRTVVGSAIAIVVQSMFAYGLSRTHLVGKKFFKFLIIFAILFNGGIIPSFLIIRYTGIFDTIWALIIPIAMSPWNVIILTSFFASLPSTLEESATIDGANDFIIFCRIAIPLSGAALGTILLFISVNHWNALMDAVIYINNTKLKPLQTYLMDLVVRSMMMNTYADPTEMEIPALSIQTAAIFASTVPILIVYPFLQRYFVKGVMIGAIKG